MGSTDKKTSVDFVMLLIVLACVAGCKEDKIAAPSGGDSAASATTPSSKVKDPPLSETDQKRLAELELKRDKLKTLVVDLKKVVESLQSETKAAEAHQREFDALRKGIEKSTLKSVLERAHQKQGESVEGKALRAQARAVDAALKATMGKTLVEKDAHPALIRTAAQIDEIQRSVRQIAPTTKVAFQARTMLLQSKLAVPELKALVKGN